MTPFEWIAVGYFAALGLAAPAARVAWERRLGVAAGCLGLAAGIAIGAPSAGTWRVWLPHFYLVAGYWLPGLLTPRIDRQTAFERWLVASDERLRRRLPAVPSLLVDVTETAYLLCYPLVPASFGLVSLYGDAGAVTRFWVAVLTSGYTSYVSLPWLLSRPPRLLANAGLPPGRVGAMNVFVLGRVSHQLNTFPSGHVAVSTAAAASVATVWPAAGAVVGAFALAIAVGAAAGRYHYVIDVLLGVAAAAGAATVAGQIG